MRRRTADLTIAAVSLALCLTLPFLTGQIPHLGSALLPMHFPVLAAGFLCGPWWAMAVGLLAPPLRFFLLGSPPYPAFVAMAAELAAYGLVSGLLSRRFGESLKGIYGALLGAMVSGRVVWGLMMKALLLAGGTSFGWRAFAAGAVLNALPGIALQLIVLPPLVKALRRTGGSRL